MINPDIFNCYNHQINGSSDAKKNTIDCGATNTDGQAAGADGKIWTCLPALPTL